MKYRKLTQAELQELEKEFIQFLATNQITAQDWGKLKVTSPDKVNGLIEVFSDIVFDKILSQVEYLEWKRKSDIRTFKLEAEKIEMLGVRIVGPSTLDFRGDDTPEQMMAKMNSANANLQLFAGEKAYNKSKQMEAFQLMEQGALISKDGAMFKALRTLKQ